MSQLLIQTGETLIKHQQNTSQQQSSSSFDFLYLLRILFYILVIMKLIQLSFLRRKKQNLKERIYRKFIFAHQEIWKQFTDEDKINMEQTLSNTLKNANVTTIGMMRKGRKSGKRVCFSVQKNSYYEPRKDQEDDDQLYLDIEEKDSFAKVGSSVGVVAESFQEKKIGDEFHQRLQLQVISEKQEQMSSQESKLTQDTQSSVIEPNTKRQIQDLFQRLQSSNDNYQPNKQDLNKKQL